MRGATNRTGTTRWLALLAMCASGLLLGATASAGDKHKNERRWHGEHQNWDHDDDSDYRDRRRHQERSSRYDDDRDWRRRSHYRDRDYDRRDWYYHGGRYWAPPRYRGRQCSDRRHHHGVHYHVAARDYYDYYYPRYRYYGPRPHGVDASVIITVPLF